MKYNFKIIEYIFFVGVIGLLSCQKKFDPNSYKPEQTFGGYSASNQIAKSNLVSLMSFEGNLIDSVNGTSANGMGTSFGTGFKGKGISFGLNNYALVSPSTSIKSLQSLTLAFWINTTQNTVGIQTPVSFVNPTQFWGNFDVFLDGQTPTSSVVKIHAFGNSGTKEAWLTSWSIASPWGSWKHIAISYDMASSTFSLYVNGTLIGSSVQAGFGAPNFANLSNIVLGTIQFNTNPSLTSATSAQPWASFVLGSMDELRIYNAALNASDVKALYQLENLGK